MSKLWPVVLACQRGKTRQSLSWASSVAVGRAALAQALERTRAWPRMSARATQMRLEGYHATVARVSMISWD